MARLLVTGGIQAMSFQRKPEWHLYDDALLVELDTAAGNTKEQLKYRTPAELCPPDDPSFVFKGATLDADDLLVVAQTEVLRISLPTMAITGRYSEPTFNDLHHVLAVDDEIYVASTGLDAVVVLSREGELLRTIDVLGGSVWDRFDRETDYRLIPTTKPHRSHPNHLFATDQGVWVTRIMQRDAICLADPTSRIEIGDIGAPHDGTVHEGRVWFTTVNGFVVKANAGDGRVEEVFDLNRIDERGRPLGWCRGLAFVDGVAYVGFSRLRDTRFRENIAWVRRGFKPSLASSRLATRVAAYDLEERKLLQEWDLEGSGMGLVFSIIPRPSGSCA